MQVGEAMGDMTSFPTISHRDKSARFLTKRKLIRAGEGSDACPSDSVEFVCKTAFLQNRMNSDFLLSYSHQYS